MIYGSRVDVIPAKAGVEANIGLPMAWKANCTMQFVIQLDKIPFMVSLSNHSFYELFDKLGVNGIYDLIPTLVV